MFIRINTLRINLDNVITLEPVVVEADSSKISIRFTSGYVESIKFKDHGGMVSVLNKLDTQLKTKTNLASRLPKDN